MCSAYVTENSASVICKEMGFDYAVDWFGVYSTILGMPLYFTSNVVISDFRCTSSANTSEECRYKVGKNIKCPSTDSISYQQPILAVVCRPLPGNWCFLFS